MALSSFCPEQPGLTNQRSSKATTFPLPENQGLRPVEAHSQSWSFLHAIIVGAAIVCIFHVFHRDAGDNQDEAWAEERAPWRRRYSDNTCPARSLKSSGTWRRRHQPPKPQQTNAAHSAFNLASAGFLCTRRWSLNVCIGAMGGTRRPEEVVEWGQC